jgi:microcystin-dependent protein
VGTRVKNFESTGIAPNGRLYAGDLNAIQDQYADLSNFAQTIDLANLRIGETALQLVRYGVAEARLSGSMRIDGIFRPLGGQVLVPLSQAQRDALTEAQRPYGLLILNTTYNRLEWNSGPAASPAWTTIVQGTLPDPEAVGVIEMFGGETAPAGYLLCDGAAISRTTFAALFSIVGTRFGAGDGGSTFNLPDFRGRMGVGKNTANGDHASLGNNDGTSLAQRRTKHRHTVNDSGHSHFGHAQAQSPYLPQSGNYGTEWEYDGQTGSAYTGITVGPQTGYEPIDGASFLTINYIIKV